MSLTSAMMVGFTGIQSNTTTVDTVGNNIANANTTAFKGERTLFETLGYQTISEGEPPGDTTGGTLPEQLGHGVTVSAIQHDFRQGSIEGTGFPSDLAIDGNGMFILNDATGAPVYTRDGALRLDSGNTLVSTSGYPIQVFPADENGEISTASLTNLVVPLGDASEAVATSEVIMDGRLDANAEMATAGAVVTSQALRTSGGAAATETTPLASLVDTSGVSLFAEGDTLTINAKKGDVAIEESTFVVGTTGSTVGDLAAHLESVLGINTDPTTGGTPGITVSAGPDPAAGTLVIQSNVGDVHAIDLTSSSIINTNGLVTAPLTFTTTSSATGEGETTSFNVYDSLGNQVDVRLRAVLESRSDNGTTWRFFAESNDDSGLGTSIGTGTITFDPNGQFLAATGTDLVIDRSDTGAATPLALSLDFSSLTGLASPDGSSDLIMDSQDGVGAGILTGYEIDDEGIVTGTFDNQRTRVYGQVALATFVNEEGLIALGENNYAQGVNSGDPTILAPRTQNAGSIVSSSLEQSNVEIAREFVNLITASTGVSSAGRVVRVADDLLQQLLLLAR